MSELLQLDGDKTMVARCQGGDAAAFAWLYVKYRDRVLRLATHLLGNYEDALDQTQESFIRAFQAIDTFNGQASFYTWLMRIAYNRCLDFRRSNVRRKARSLDGGDCGDDDPVDFTPAADNWDGPGARAEFSELAGAVDEAMTRLTPAHRTVLTRYASGDFRYRELADEIGISSGTVMSRLYHARKRVHCMLEERGVL